MIEEGQMIDKDAVLRWVSSVETTHKPRREVPKGEIPNKVDEQFLAASIDLIRALCDELDASCRFREEILTIKETFELAIKAKSTSGGQHVPYHGDFASITPSTLRELEWWVRRWKKVLCEE